MKPKVSYHLNVTPKCREMFSSWELHSRKSALMSGDTASVPPSCLLLAIIATTPRANIGLAWNQLVYHNVESLVRLSFSFYKAD